jgi:hypothetical protein
MQIECQVDIAAWQEMQQQRTAPEGSQNAERSADEGEQEALSEHLPDQACAARADGAAYCQLAPPSRRARKEHVRHVGTRDQQNAANQSEQDE